VKEEEIEKERGKKKKKKASDELLFIHTQKTCPIHVCS
jgi:hypothetical protein